MTVPTSPIIPAPPVSPLAPPVQGDFLPSDRQAATASLAGEGSLPRIAHEQAPAWLISMILHTLALILLALLSVTRHTDRAAVLLATTEEPSAVDPLPLEILQQPTPQALDDARAAEQPSEVPIAIAAPTSLATRSPLEPQRAESNPVADAVAKLAHDALASTSLPLPTGGGLQGRSPEGRLKWGRQYGATPESEAAVERALRWLADHQRADGSWSFDLSNAPCKGRCNDGRNNPDRLPAPPTAATGLALLAFLGAGYTHESGPYVEVVDRGLYYLRGQMRPSEFGSDLQLGSMYGHGIATLAITEAASMTADPELRKLAEELTLFILAARHPGGSWGYSPGAPGDMTLTAWQVMALKGSKRLKISMPTDVFSSTKTYVDSLSPDGGIHFGYRQPAIAKTPTAIGLTMEIYLGRSPREPAQQQGLSQLIEWGPTLKNVYHDYYATLALHHARHPSWQQWHTPLQEHLIQTQGRVGHEQGSWHFPDHYGDVGGRVYTTAMCAMMLEVYYRYLPLYEETTEFPL